MSSNVHSGGTILIVKDEFQKRLSTFSIILPHPGRLMFLLVLGKESLFFEIKMLFNLTEVQSR